MQEALEGEVVLRIERLVGVVVVVVVFRCRVLVGLAARGGGDFGGL